METLKIKTIKIENYKFELSENYNNKPVCKFSQLMTRGKNKGTYKIIESYYFNTEEKRSEYIKNKIERINKYKKEEEERKNKKIEAQKSFKNPYQIGEIFYDSWGYEQTNIDFYQIIGIKNKSVIFQKIAQNVVPNSEGFMSEYVTPAIDTFIGEEFTKQVKLNVNYDGKQSYYCGFTKYDMGEKGLYQSHYA